MKLFLCSAVPKLFPYLMHNDKYRDCNSATYMIALLQYPLFTSQHQLLLLFVVCVLLHLYLVSCGLYSLIYLLIFPYPNKVRVDTNTELVVLCVTLVFVAWHHVWHRLYLLYNSTLMLKTIQNYYDAPLSFVFLFTFDSNHISYLYLHLLCVMHHIVPFSKVSQMLFFPCFPCCLFTLVDKTTVSFYLWSNFI